jgi:hypothetical protein
VRGQEPADLRDELRDGEGGGGERGVVQGVHHDQSLTSGRYGVSMSKNTPILPKFSLHIYAAIV